MRNLQNETKNWFLGLTLASLWLVSPGATAANTYVQYAGAVSFDTAVTSCKAKTPPTNYNAGYLARITSTTEMSAVSAKMPYKVSSWVDGKLVPPESIAHVTDGIVNLIDVMAHAIYGIPIDNHVGGMSNVSLSTNGSSGKFHLSPNTSTSTLGYYVCEFEPKLISTKMQKPRSTFVQYAGEVDFDTAIMSCPKQTPPVGYAPCYLARITKSIEMGRVARMMTDKLHSWVDGTLTGLDSVAFMDGKEPTVFDDLQVPIANYVSGLSNMSFSINGDKLVHLYANAQRTLSYYICEFDPLPL